MAFDTRNCKRCSISFQVRKAEINRGGGLYCSRECGSRARKGITYVLLNQTCAYCTKPVYVKPSSLKKKPDALRFCNRTCKDAHKRASNPHIIGNCLQCNKEIKRQRGKKFCSHNCCFSFKRNQMLNDWLNGKRYQQSDSMNLPDFIRDYLFSINKNSCQKCGWNSVNPKSGKIPLTVNHIDGNSCNDSPSNLELICPNCHSLTPNYGSLNKGNGRQKRLEKIREKKLA